MIEQVDNHVVRLEHLIGTSLQADTLTKPKARPDFEQNTKSLMGPQR